MFSVLPSLSQPRRQVIAPAYGDVHDGDMEIEIRKFEIKDAAAAAQLYFDSVRHGTGSHYNAAQRQAWAPEVPDAVAWGARLAKNITLMAVDAQGPAGFISLQHDGHLDLAFVRPDLIGQGVAKKLYLRIEEDALAIGLTTLDTDASELAKPFFERLGWQVGTTQHPVRFGVQLTTYRMIKTLA
jgi:putative acetyltransferase